MPSAYPLKSNADEREILFDVSLCRVLIHVTLSIPCSARELGTTRLQSLSCPTNKLHSEITDIRIHVRVRVLCPRPSKGRKSHRVMLSFAVDMHVKPLPAECRCMVKVID